MRVRLAGCVGEDLVGRWMREQLAPAGLASDLIVVPDAPTGLTVALESEQRDRTFLTYLGVNATWVASMIGDELLDCEHLLLCDYFVAPALKGDPARGLLETARGHGASTYFDTAWDPGGFAERTRAEVYGLLAAVDVFLPNEAEACALAGADDAAECARILHQVSGSWIVVKLGSRGCVAVGPGGTELRVGAPTVEVADTTGAGDAFNAGLIHALSTGATWHEALSAATAFASEIVSRPSDARYLIGSRS
jgi:sugar/nucleoside kinase (ribokinase family)